MRDLETRLYTKLQSHDAVYKALAPVGVLCLTAEMIWLAGPYLAWENYAPLAQPEKRIYIILFIFLAWLLKFLIIDLDAPNPFQYKNTAIRNKLIDLQNRFKGAVQFLNKTNVTKHGKLVNLSDLPWYLFIGPSQAGKTTLLATSDIHFILQRQFQNQDLQNMSPSESCDWWVTRDASIIDVPGKYLSVSQAGGSPDAGRQSHVLLWQFFLRMIRKQRGKNGINGIIIALPAPEIMKLNDTKQYHAVLRELFQQIHSIQKQFPQPMPCQIIITKCDLLTGFKEFFAESSKEELTQAWGITLSSSRHDEKITELFSVRFNALIKKINQQLLFRLHQERNPMARPYIKDFPLQVERLKEFMTDFMKKISHVHRQLQVQGVYLTSAIQPAAESDDKIVDQTVNTSARAVQIFKEPSPSSRAYFVKQFLAHGLGNAHMEQAPQRRKTEWKRRSAYAVSIIAIAAAGALLGKNFQQGVRQTYALQKNLSDYQLKMAQLHDPDEHLDETVKMLDSLHQSTDQSRFKLDLSYLLSFYTHKSQQKANAVYQHALATIFIPEIRNYFEEYLQIPINKDADDVYAVLKAYLMMGDATYFNPEHISTTLLKILPKSMQKNEMSQLSDHLQTALGSAWSPSPLNTKTIQGTRKYLITLPSLKLSYIILKNLDSNYAASEINIGTNTGDNQIFTLQQISNQIPAMFTAKSFASIISQESILAAQEATAGNWVLGHSPEINKNLALATPLIEQLRTTYINNYVDVWESLLANIHLASPSDLGQTDAMIVNLISNDSPLLQLLQTLHDNTYFEPIVSSSPKLQNLGLLVEKNTASQNLLYEIFAGLQSLHHYLQAVLGAENEKKAAFDAVSSRMLSRGTPDAITQLRIIAEKSPEPVKFWLAQIANDSWTFLMQDAGKYLDTSWQNKVMHFYRTDIANRYPFSTTTDQEVEVSQFARFFGKSGVVLSFYNQYLQPFVDTSTQDWHWKKIDGNTLPFSEDTLRQIQHAMRIHRTFFPNGDNQIHVQFDLQPYKFGKLVKTVKLNINNKQFVDNSDNLKNTHSIAWPAESRRNMTSIQLILTNNETITRKYPGSWGWFKLINQSFENMISKKELLINLSLNEHTAKYILSTEGQNNPFLSLNLRHFRLPQQLTNEKA
ncbi:hypothetical protein AQUSIP_19990 [Aquicella siphonis]|uniref:IcmF-related N-terminal domain-containing protein n=1 Tax=Aquicella siphonis TaxID=254247 RepID=A0A5E4PJC9_9COXI|nr:hypothetical protein AQUSIP_19990 [Aquicella siphonis]